MLLAGQAVTSACAPSEPLVPPTPSTSTEAEPSTDDEPSTSMAPPAAEDPTALTPAPFGTAADRLPAARLLVAGGEGLELLVRVADTPEAQERGLQGVQVLPEGTGMLFVFAEDRRGGFWMRETLVALDIAFIDASGRVVAVAGMVPCAADPCPITDPGVPYRAALEAGAGVLAGVVPGDVVTWEPAGR